MLALLTRQAGALLALALLPALVSGLVQLKWTPDAPLLPGEVRPATAGMWGDSVQWIDARPDAEFARAHLPGALPLTPASWNQQSAAFLKHWDPARTLVVYASQRDSAPAVAVAHRLREELKLDGVYVLKGGFEAWQRE